MVELYRRFNAMHAQVLEPHIEKPRRLALLLEMETIVREARELRFKKSD